MKTNLTLAILLSGITLACAATYYVAPDGDDSRTGLGGWNNALATISNGIFLAANGDCVLVSNGEYKITAVLSITKGIVLTNLSGNPQDTIINAQGLSRVIYLSHDNAVVSSFSVINGRHNDGAGICIYRGTVNNCHIYNNRTSGGDGGGVELHANGSIYDCTIYSNTARHGGGVHCNVGGVVERCHITQNVSTNNDYGGGGLYLYAGGSARGCDIISNTAQYGGGGVYLNTAVGKCGAIADCLIKDNVATNHGGGVYVTDGEVSNCKIISNKAINQYGGGIRIQAGRASRCEIVGNKAKGYGGGVYMTGGNIDNALIYGNESTNSYGGGIYLYGGGTSENCTVIGNICKLSSGGGIYCNQAGAIFNAISQSNLAAGVLNNVGNQGVLNMFYSHCCADTTNAMPGVGNIAGDADFVDYAAGNFRLARGSICINSGTNQAWMGTAVDLDGHRRLDRMSRIVDMGAYEYIHQGTMFLLQ
ncbi:MAG: choice-of-anchor Q domain-containing protein [Kiritimatiellia bacterium]